MEHVYNLLGFFLAVIVLPVFVLGLSAGLIKSVFMIGYKMTAKYHAGNILR